MRWLGSLSGFVLVLVGTMACGDSGDSEASPGSAIGGAAVGAGGTSTGVGGSLGTGGAGTGGAGTEDSPLAGCPPPRETLPHVGPWMSGPHPGPCSKRHLGYVTTYVYDDAGKLLRGEISDGRVETYERDGQGRITAIDDEYGRTEYDYSEPGQVVTWHNDTQSNRYIVDELLRPFDIYIGSTLLGTYDYEDCRLVGITAADATSAPVSATIEYDAEGNYVRRINETNEMIFDYSCW